MVALSLNLSLNLFRKAHLNGGFDGGQRTHHNRFEGIPFLPAFCFLLAAFRIRPILACIRSLLTSCVLTNHPRRAGGNSNRRRLPR